MKQLFYLTCFIFIGFTATAQNNYDVAQYFKTLQNAKKLYSQKQWKDAAIEYEKVILANPLQGNIWYNLGTVYYNTKEYKKAIPAYQKVCEIKSYEHQDALYNVACCYALLNNKDSAFYYLEKASFKVPNYRRYAMEDADFQPYREDAKFKLITGQFDVSKLNREEGWKFDLNFFSSEYKKVHYAPFQKITEKQFDDAMLQITAKINQLTDMQLALELMKLLRVAADGHSGIFAHYIKTAFPLQFYIFEDGVHIISADKKYADLVGSQVLNLNKVDIATVLKTINPIISLDGENQQAAKVLSAEYLRMPIVLKALNLIENEEKISFTIKDAQGNTKTVEIKAEEGNVFIHNNLPNPEGWVNMQAKLGDKTPLYMKSPNKTYWFEYLKDEKTVYFQYNSVRNNPEKPLNQFLAELHKFIDDNKVEKLVLDLRWNNGGNTYLLPPLLQALIQNSKINQKDKFFCIIGRRTFSAAQNLTSLIERFTNATLVGEPAGSSPNFIGEDLPFTLPYSKLPVNFSNLYWQSSIPTDKRAFTAPEILIIPTFADYKIGKDRCLESILSIK